MLVEFGASLAGTFQFDDFGMLGDPAVASPSGWWESWRLEQTRPLTWFTFWLSYQLSGEQPFGYHAVSLALHVAVVLLLFDLLERTLTPRAALFAAAIFAVHPIQAEAVNYIFARGTLLAALFSVLAARSWILDRPWVATAWFAVAMLAKEECVALPVLLALADWSRGRRFKGAPLGAMCGIALALGLRVIWAASAVNGSQAGSQAGISPFAYFLVQGLAIWRYLRMLIVPRGFTVDVEIASRTAWVGALGWLALVGCAAATRRFVGFWAIGGLLLLLPSSSIFPAADLAADRRMYLPMLALCAAAGFLAGRVDRRWAAAVVILLAAISLRYTLIWRSPEALWSEAAMRAPSKVRPRLQLARAVERAGDPVRALGVLEQARRMAPEDASLVSEQGRILLELGRADEALASFGKALALDPTDARAMNNRGAALLALGQREAAREDFERALGRDGCLFDARLNLARMGVTTVAHGCRYTPRQRLALGE